MLLSQCGAEVNLPTAAIHCFIFGTSAFFQTQILASVFEGYRLFPPV